MLGISGLTGNSGGGDSAGNHEAGVGVGGAITGGFGREKSDRNSAGNRWPRQETLALLKIRSDMDVAFRDSALKGPLWEEVSRKLAELGYHRTAKKCKEKFENVYKYYKRTKEGRSSRPDSKTYRFFDQLEALDSHPLLPSHSPEKLQTPLMAEMPTNLSQIIVPSRSQNPTTDFLSPSTSPSSSSGKEPEENSKKKRKMAAFFDRLMKDVIEKQEVLQKKFIEALEKRENDRMVREEAWKMQEFERMNREHEIIVQERSMTAAKDAAVIAFLQKISEESNPPVQLPENPSSSQKILDYRRLENAENFIRRSSSRWPKAEVQALIKLRTSLDLKYQETGPKGSLWEEISSAMKKLGYNRSSKRCKEKWENINKYFKRVKERNTKRLEDSKTCPYFDQLDALYKEKTEKIMGNSLNPGFGLNREDLLQPLQVQEQRPESVMEDHESENMDDQNQEEDGDEDDDEGGGYEIVTNKPSSRAIVA
ncbi:hypothetical protein HHK36_030534 [Tetracentron sinense]|uniref:Myb-like domain-containing protein n=1 Tax=Tetracentron sinense TaxID=13715 RepID=A0A834YCB1_TETSI|nr:hypothetical protein HHK36_030534 [Tetracentron sinense]